MQDLSLSRSIRSVDIVGRPLLGKAADTDDTKLEGRRAICRPPAPVHASADGRTPSQLQTTTAATHYDTLAAHAAGFNCLNDPDNEDLAGHRDLCLLECVYLVDFTLVQ